MKVNMTPNPLDVVTIHASQGDTEARQWGFELHNNGELIDTSDVKEQLVFKAYKGGTEQLLPENTSTPVTSPFKGDIRYPQGLLTDQEFTYRQSPTESDGLAKITDIKGNTLVWNQLVPPLSAMQGQNGTLSVADNVATITSSSSVTYLGISTSGSSIVLPKGGHKYLLTAEVKSSKALSSCNIWYGNSIAYIQRNIPANTWTKVSTIASYGTPTGQYVQLRAYGSFEQGDTMQVRNWNYFDLTAMGLDSLTFEEFASLFPLSYYSYNQGSLLSFNGNGIKTVGKNLLEYATSGTAGGVTFTVNDDGSITANGTATYNDTFDFYRNTTALPSWAKLGQTYTLSLTNPINRFDIYSYDSSGATTSLVYTSGYASRVFTIPNDAVGMLIRIFITSGVTYDVTIYPQIEKGTTATEYEPYISSTLSLPISTYFPNGMKSAGNVYDELTESKAITRIGSVDLGTLNWRAYTDVTTRKIYYATISGMDSMSAQIACGGLTVVPWGALPNMAEKTIQAHPSLSIVYACDSSCEDATEFTSVMSGVYLYYELATSTENSFTTASLVTENADIPLSNEDGTLIGKCTEELSAEPGFHDAKIKLSDSDGECYSNKLQLHIERSPQ